MGKRQHKVAAASADVSADSRAPAPDAEHFVHLTILRDEVTAAIAALPAANAVAAWAVDATLGGGGHTESLLDAVPSLRVLGMDRDSAAHAAAAARLQRLSPRFEAVHAPFSQLSKVLEDPVWQARLAPLGGLAAVVADLGVSSPQLDHAHRGFSFRFDGPLDMRMDPTQGPTAADLLASVKLEDLADVLYQYGDIERSIGTARIVLQAFHGGATTTAALAAELSKRLPRSRSMHPATMVFQALRIWVNAELTELETLLRDVPGLLAPGGLLAIITFHSGEDRLVKQAFAALAGPDSGFVRPTRKGVSPSAAEVAANPRARSARLRLLRRRHPDDPPDRYVADGGKWRDDDED
jgi:16S rRNA (cytosine1402-N4)-methyltransferase